MSIDYYSDFHLKEFQKIINKFKPEIENCRLKVTFRLTNLGLTKHIVDAINSAFKQFNYVIVLEDDVIFTSESIISVYDGIDEFGEKSDFGAISMFSPIHGKNLKKLLIGKNYWRKTNYFGPWGWATNKKTWLKYSNIISESHSSKLKQSPIFSNMSKTSQNVWNGRFGKVIFDPLKTWEFQFQHLLFRELLKVYAPVLTLSGNIGFDDLEATNTKQKAPLWVTKKLSSIRTPKKMIKSKFVSNILMSIDKNTFSYDTRLSQLYLKLKKSILFNNT